MTKVFCSYSHKDERMRQQLQSHLALLIRLKEITLWSDRVILPGDEIDSAISKNLEAADIILLLVSADFLASSYCYDIEVRRALELHELRKARVIPVILRDCDWHRAPFGKLSSVPIDGRPVKSWPDRDKAYLSIVSHLRNLIESRPSESIDPSQISDNIAPETHPPAATLDLTRLAARAVRSSPQRRYDAQAMPLPAFMRQLGQLIEISDDVSRMAEDNSHALGGKRINYVFDTNVFQLFLQPRRLPHAVSLFHSHQWEPAADRYAWHRIDNQSALLTSEYLFSGSLPGQSEGVVYLTQWHRVELLSQLNHLISDTWERSNNPDIARSFVYRMARFRADMTGSRNCDPKAISDDPQIAADIDFLREEGVSEQDLKTYLSTRMALSALVDDEHFSTFCQLRRLADQNILRSARSAESLGELSDAAVQEVRDDARLWLGRINEELERRGERSRVYARRHSSLRDDALSIALVHVLDRHCRSSDDLTLFVTGDAILFAAYRRWHSTSKSDQPFLMRRLAQYAPIFTLGDPDVVASPRPSVLDEFAELGLIPFNINRSKFAYGNAVKHRLLFSQQISDGDWDPHGHLGRSIDEVFTEVKSDWYHKYMREVQELGSVWRQVESITLGLNPDLLSFRLASVIPDDLTFQADEADFSDQEIMDWLNAAIASLHQNALELWLPLALDSIRRAQSIHDSELAEHRFVWADLTFQFAIGGAKPKLITVGSSSGVNIALNTVPGPNSISEVFLEENPMVAFGMAAIANAEIGRFADAARFANLCLEIAKASGAPENIREAERIVSTIGGLAQEIDQGIR